MNTTKDERIIQGVEDRTERIASLLQELIRVDSRTGSEGPIQQRLAEIMRAMGLTVDVFEPDLGLLQKHPAYNPPAALDYQGRPNVVSVWEGHPGARSLLLNGHVDTIPPDPVDAWNENPFSGSIKDGQVFGCGASDMKSGLVALLMGLQTLLDLGLRPQGRVILEAVVDEELTGYGTLGCILRGYKADAGICAETSDLQIMPACIGRLWFTITVRGKSSGIASRWEGISAIEKGIKIVQAIEDLQQIRLADLAHPLYKDNRSALPCMVTMFNAGTFPSAVPEQAVLRGSLGLLPFENAGDVKAQVLRHLEMACSIDVWLRDNPPVVSFKDTGAGGAEIPADHPIVQTLAGAYGDATRRPPIIAGRCGGSDTRYLIKYGNTPTVIFGPGVTSKMHMINESVPISNLVDATKTIALAIARWCDIQG